MSDIDDFIKNIPQLQQTLMSMFINELKQLLTKKCGELQQTILKYLIISTMNDIDLKVFLPCFLKVIGVDKETSDKVMTAYNLFIDEVKQAIQNELKTKKTT